MVGYLLTMGKGSEDARTWAFSGLLALAVFEYQARLSRGLDEFWSFERRLERRRASTCTGRRENSRLTRA